jgi:hypothetical protein
MTVIAWWVALLHFQETSCLDLADQIPYYTTPNNRYDASSFYNALPLFLHVINVGTFIEVYVVFR